MQRAPRAHVGATPEDTEEREAVKEWNGSRRSGRATRTQEMLSPAERRPLTGAGERCFLSAAVGLSLCLCVCVCVCGCGCGGCPRHSIPSILFSFVFSSSGSLLVHRRLKFKKRRRKLRLLYKYSPSPSFFLSLSLSFSLFFSVCVVGSFPFRWNHLRLYDAAPYSPDLLLLLLVLLLLPIEECLLLPCVCVCVLCIRF